MALRYLTGKFFEAVGALVALAALLAGLGVISGKAASLGGELLLLCLGGALFIFGWVLGTKRD